MKKLSKEQYIGVVVTLIVAALIFFGFSLLSSINNGQTTNNNDQKNNMADQLKTEVLREGQGDVAALSDTVTVNYTGTLEDGTKFDSSYDRGTPFPVNLGQGRVIPGWEQGLLGVKVGEKLRLTIPSSLGYGDNGIPDGKGGFIIPPKSTLIFEIEVMKIDKAPAK